MTIEQRYRGEPALPPGLVGRFILTRVHLHTGGGREARDPVHRRTWGRVTESSGWTGAVLRRVEPGDGRCIVKMVPACKARGMNYSREPAGSQAWRQARRPPSHCYGSTRSSLVRGVGISRIPHLRSSLREKIFPWQGDEQGNEAGIIGACRKWRPAVPPCIPPVHQGYCHPRCNGARVPVLPAFRCETLALGLIGTVFRGSPAGSRFAPCWHEYLPCSRCHGMTGLAFGGSTVKSGGISFRSPCHFVTWTPEYHFCASLQPFMRCPIIGDPGERLQEKESPGSLTRGSCKGALDRAGYSTHETHAENVEVCHIRDLILRAGTTHDRTSG